MPQMHYQEDIPADVSELIREGAIVSVDLKAARCVVRYGDPNDEDGGATTPPIRWFTGRSGKTRKWSPPSEGEAVILLVPDGQIAAAVALCGVPTDAFPPAGDTLAELVEYEDGAKIGYDPESHALTAVLPGGGTASIEAPGGVTIKGAVTIEGDVAVSGDVVADGISLKYHLTPGITRGSALSDPPAS
ncbi:phage baseplate assembly protein V [Novosphingobium sp. 9]|uniref:phage baseplate assembly protein V n=1 Tax=Novosphingobium sp. 9 TaxID=2025349 RepID=UPI0021B5ECAA|nr:phage baseplate assembly protein V [Novosphingobium sp. 9]